MDDYSPIYDVTPFTMLDYPNKTACILWFAGCNMRCKFCYNPDILRAKGTLTEEDVLRFLKKRVGKIEGVVLSGGECTTYKDLPRFVKKVKALGFSIKMDTNGTRPQVVKKMVEDGLVDYIAMDFKAPEGKFYSITKSKRYNFFLETLKFLCEEKRVSFEIRTTVHTNLLHEDDLKNMASTLEEYGYEGTYYVQNYRHSITEGDLEDQWRTLDMAGYVPEKINMEYRNF